jgi:hypothetical protein
MLHLKFLENKISKTQNKQKERNNKKKRVKINEIETKKPTQGINKTKSWFFEKINTIDKSLANLTKMRRERKQIIKSETQMGR